MPEPLFGDTDFRPEGENFMICILNRNAPASMYDKLSAAGHLAVPGTAVPALPASIRTHPDIQIHQLDTKLAICAPECFSHYRRLLPQSIRLVKRKTCLSGTYPGDCAYNVARTGNYLFCNTNCVDPLLLTYYQRQGKQVFHVNQGYTKCNLCVISDQLVLTEDIGIHNTIMGYEISVASVLLPVGAVALEGFPYGFIGGACGRASHTVYWFGDPASCGYYSRIRELLYSHGIQSIALDNGPLRDLGGIICFP